MDPAPEEPLEPPDDPLPLEEPLPLLPEPAAPELDELPSVLAAPSCDAASAPSLVPADPEESPHAVGAKVAMATHDASTCASAE